MAFRPPSRSWESNCPVGSRERRDSNMQDQELKHPTRQLLQALRSGQLSASDAAAVERHVSGCEACRKTLESLPGNTRSGAAKDSTFKSKRASANAGAGASEKRADAPKEGSTSSA